MGRSLHLAIFIVFALTDLGLACFAIRRDHAQTVDRAVIMLERTANMLSEHAGRSIEAGDSILLTMQEMASHWDFRDPTEGRRIQLAMERQVGRLPQVASAWLIDGSSGKTLVENWGYPPKSTIDSRTRSYFRFHDQGGANDLFIGDPRPGTITGKERFTLSRAVRSPDGALRAVAVTGVFAGYFIDVFQEQGLPGGGRFMLATDDGLVLAHNPAAGEAVEAELTAKREVAGLPVTVTVAVRQADVLREWRWRATWVAVVALGALIGFALLVAMGLKSLRAEREARAGLEAAKRGLEDEVQRRTRALEEALAKAREANQSKLTFIAEVSHDLRQPLQGTTLFIDAVLAAKPDPRLVKLGEMCLHSLEFGRRLLDELLTFAKLDAGVATIELSSFELGPLLGQIGESLRADCERKGIGLRVVPGRATVVSDPARLRQMIENLAVNAVKFTAEGRILIGVRRRGDFVAIQVCDTGIGIPPEHMDRIFSAFHQVEPGRPSDAADRKGVGLGLSIVDRSARLLGHKVSVRSRLGHGTIFTIEIPLAPAPAVMAEPMPV